MNRASLDRESLDCVSWTSTSRSLTISFHLYFSVSLKFGACYITGQWTEFRTKTATLCLYLFFWYFFCYFSTKNLFLNKIDLIYHFYFFFWWSLKFPQENIKQSEIGIGDKKFSAEHIFKTGTHS